ncbi:MAG TPA: hypothetical protein VFM55_22365 [Micromonosporaceae bacterium]|nr:hypothetical protein [Micromonosporaceae bacterium]
MVGTWVRALVTALATAAMTAAGQLGVCYGLGILRWQQEFAGDDVNLWSAHLTWTAWIAAIAVIAGALAGVSALRRHRLHPGFGGWAGAALAATPGAAVAVPLVAVPASAAELPFTNPALEAGIAAAVGILAGVFGALAMLCARLIAGSVYATIFWVWAVALASAGAVMGSSTPPRGQRLGVLALPGMSFDLTQDLVLAMTAGTAVLLGGLIAGYGRWLGEHRLVVAASGLAGPALLAAAYLIAGPGRSSDPPDQLVPYWAALIGVGAGAVTSVLVALVRRPQRAQPDETDETDEPDEIAREAPDEPDAVSWPPPDRWKGLDRTDVDEPDPSGSDPSGSDPFEPDRLEPDRLGSDRLGSDWLGTDRPGDRPTPAVPADQHPASTGLWSASGTAGPATGSGWGGDPRWSVDSLWGETPADTGPPADVPARATARARVPQPAPAEPSPLEPRPVRADPVSTVPTVTGSAAAPVRASAAAQVPVPDPVTDQPAQPAAKTRKGWLGRGRRTPVATPVEADPQTATVPAEPAQPLPSHPGRGGRAGPATAGKAVPDDEYVSWVSDLGRTGEDPPELAPTRPRRSARDREGRDAGGHGSG